MRVLYPTIVALCWLGCSSSGNGGPVDSGPLDAGVDVAPDAAPPGFCTTEGLTERPFSAGPYGTLRHDLADDFTLEMVDGSTWTFSEEWTGCESYLFIPDTLPTSDTDPTSLWEYPADLAELVSESPRNVHYFFVSRRSNDSLADESTSAQATRVDDLLATLSAADADHWQKRLHVVKTRAGAMDNWIGPLLQSGIFRGGMAIDRFQALRGIGSLADVNRYTGTGGWPFNGNLAYVAYEARYHEQQEALQVRLDAQGATVVPLFSGDLLAQFADVTVALPSASEMAGFDSFEVEVVSECPYPDRDELVDPTHPPYYDNCGAWDYIAALSVDDGTGTFIELARFITSYHRETRWVVDATPMLVHLLDGGSRTFRWDFAPPWNTQPTITSLSLRFFNRSAGYKPTEAVFLWSGGAFNSGYNAAHAPIDVAIPADATRVELWAIITGHGGETNNCAEFCNHQHEFTVGSSVYTKDYPEATTTEGCVAQIANGAVPNQGGTWWYGRGGWCPGLQVEPFVQDVTGDVTPGTTATVSYRGLLFGTDPPDSSGNIDLVSYLVFYR